MRLRFANSKKKANTSSETVATVQASHAHAHTQRAKKKRKKRKEMEKIEQNGKGMHKEYMRESERREKRDDILHKMK